MGFLNMIGRFANSQMGRSAIGWLGQKVSGVLGGLASKAGNLLMKSPIGGAIRQLGPSVANWIGEKTFDTTMRKFGDNINDRVRNSKLQPVMDGFNIGDTYYNGMKKVYGFLRDGGQDIQADGQTFNASPQVERQ